MKKDIFYLDEIACFLNACFRIVHLFCSRGLSAFLYFHVHLDSRFSSSKLVRGLLVICMNEILHEFLNTCVLTKVFNFLLIPMYLSGTMTF